MIEQMAQSRYRSDHQYLAYKYPEGKHCKCGATRLPVSNKRMAAFYEKVWICPDCESDIIESVRGMVMSDEEFAKFAREVWDGRR